MSKASDAYDNMDRDTKAALHDLQIEAEQRKFRAAMTIPARERLVKFFKTLVGIDLTEHAEYLAGEMISAFPEIGEDKAQLDKVREALRPFAAPLHSMTHHLHDDASVMVKIGDLRRAAAAMEGKLSPDVNAANRSPENAD